MSPGKSNPSREILNLIDEMEFEMYELQNILLLTTYTKHIMRLL
jgi:hypothetical protein